jgi:hypothetical protein
VAEWLGRALQKLPQRFDSARYLTKPIPAFRDFFMTEEEKRFVAFWQEQRLRKKQYLRRFSIGFPLGVLVAAAILVNFLSGWYKRADAALHADSSVIVVVVVALSAIVAFITVFSAHHQWDRNEAEYQRLSGEIENEKSNTTNEAEEPIV